MLFLFISKTIYFGIFNIRYLTKMNCLKFMTLLALVVLSVQLAYAKERGECGANGSSDCCDGQCEIGEGDCDWNSDCLDGLKCDYDWFWGQDHCIAGMDILYRYSFVRWVWGMHIKYISHDKHNNPQNCLFFCAN